MTDTRNARPLTARSLIASMLLGLDPPRTSGQFLVRSNELFGVSEGTTRTALSRMVAAGELTVDEGVYELAGDLRTRQSRQADSRRAERLDWDGTWVLHVVDRTQRSRPERADLRRAARRLRLVEWREGLWCRPDNLPADRLPESRAVLSTQCSTVYGAVPDRAPLDRFDAEAWAARARRLVSEMAGLRAPLADAGAAALADGFVLTADVIRHLGADPLLPDELTPSDWPGAELRADFAEHERAFAAAHRSWFRP